MLYSVQGLSDATEDVGRSIHGRIPLSSIPTGSVIVDTFTPLASATCSVDDCGVGYCLSLCPSPCCVMQILPRCDSGNPFECCKLGQHAISTQTYNRTTIVTSRGSSSVPFDSCPQSQPCGFGSGMVYGPVRSWTETESYRMVIQFDCVANTATCISSSYSRSKNGFAVGPIVVDGCIVRDDTPQYYDESVSLERMRPVHSTLCHTTHSSIRILEWGSGKALLRR